MALPVAAWGLSRYALDAQLAAAVAQHGGRVWHGATVTGVARHDTHYRVEIRDESRGERRTTTVQARAVIMACGRYSSAALPPRNNAEGDARRGWRNCVGLKIHYQQVQMEPRVELYLFPGGYVGINPIEGDRANVCVLITYAAFQAAGKSLACVLATAAQRHGALAQRLHGARPLAESECAVAPVDTQRAPAPWDAATGAPCLGDTAAMIPPLAGDGMAMALRAAELCLDPADEFLRGQLSLDGWEAAYSRAWRGEFAARLQLGQALQSALTTRGLGDTLGVLGRGLPFAAHWLLAATRGHMA
jgi:flavin-dependent dehydrogenase